MIEDAYRREDVPALAALHRRAFPGFFLSRLGEPFLRQLYLGFLDDPDAVVAVARRGDRIVGACVGTVRPAGFFRRLLRRRWPGFVLAGLRAAVTDLRTVPRLLAAVAYRGDVPAGEQGALLSSLCVDPEAAGGGLGHALEARWCRNASRHGAAVAFLTTDTDDNERVHRFYRAAGWALADTYTTGQGRRMSRYRRTLAPGDPAGEAR